MSRTEDEMRRGAAIAHRARRSSDLDRLNAAGKVAIKLSELPPSATVSGFMATFVVDGVEVCSEWTMDAEYPSDRVLATVNLAISASVGFDGVPDPKPSHKVSPEGKEYNRRLREANRTRWDNK